MATSVSASRWRTAWNSAIGWPNWIRSRAWSRASSSIAREAPTSSWPSGQLGQGDGLWPGHRRPAGPVPRSPGHRHRTPRPDPSAGRCRGPPGGSGRRWPPRRPASVVGRSATTTARGACRPGWTSPCRRRARLVLDHPSRRAPVRPRAGRTTPGGGPTLSPRAEPTTVSRAEDDALAVPCCSNRAAIAVRAVVGQGLGPAELGRGPGRGSRRWPTRRRGGGSRSNSARSSSSISGRARGRADGGR